MDPIFFTSHDEFRDWLEEHHDTAEELWIGYDKVDAEPVEEALCFGWIDGPIRGIDDETTRVGSRPESPTASCRRRTGNASKR